MMVIHSDGAATTKGDMSLMEDPFESFDPCSTSDPRHNMPGVLDLDVENNQLNVITSAAVDKQLLSAQEQAIRSEANALHTEVMDRQRETLVSEVRDHLTRVEQAAAEQISQRTLQLNEQAARAMSEHKSLLNFERNPRIIASRN